MSPVTPNVTYILNALLDELIERKDLLLKEINHLTESLEYLGKEYDAHIALIKRVIEFKERGTKV
jgi:hypothetical protein